jgi:hypothetical protein
MSNSITEYTFPHIYMRARIMRPPCVASFSLAEWKGRAERVAAAAEDFGWCFGGHHLYCHTSPEKNASQLRLCTSSSSSAVVLVLASTVLVPQSQWHYNVLLYYF